MSTFRKILEDKLDHYFPKTEARSKTNTLIDTVMESKFADWAKKYNQDAHQGKGVASTDTITKFLPGESDDPNKKWEVQVKKQWDGMHAGQRRVFSDPPAQIDDHPIYKQVATGPNDQKKGVKKFMKWFVSKRKQGKKYSSLDLAAVQGFDRFAANQWNGSIQKQQGFGGGPGNEQWENRIKQLHNSMQSPKPDFDAFREIKVNEYEATHS